MFLTSTKRISESNGIYEFSLSILWLIMAMQKTPLLEKDAHSHIVQLDLPVILLYKYTKKSQLCRYENGNSKRFNNIL